MKAAVLGRPFHIGFSGPTDFHYVADTAAAFVACADGGPAGAAVYNLHGDSVDVAAVVAEIEALCPAAAGKLTSGGPRIPIPPQLDGSAIRQAYPTLPHTPLREGIATTVAGFRRLHAAGQLDRRDLPGG
jgi:nucleoside-diphosphate-sugar epimerase